MEGCALVELAGYLASVVGVRQISGGVDGAAGAPSSSSVRLDALAVRADLYWIHWKLLGEPGRRDRRCRGQPGPERTSATAMCTKRSIGPTDPPDLDHGPDTRRQGAGESERCSRAGRSDRQLKRRGVPETDRDVIVSNGPTWHTAHAPPLMEV